MKLSKRAKARLKLATATEKKEIAKSSRILFDFDLISTKRALTIKRSL